VLHAGGSRDGKRELSPVHARHLAVHENVLVIWRCEYYDQLLAVSRRGDWNNYMQFFSTGLDASAYPGAIRRFYAPNVLDVLVRDQRPGT
jgi:hypothetical protein